MSKKKPGKSAAKSRKKQASSREAGAILIYHDMLVSENFERCVERLFSIVQVAQEQHPGKRRILEAETTTHFGVKRKPSTEAWAFHKARLNLQL